MDTEKTEYDVIKSYFFGKSSVLRKSLPKRVLSVITSPPLIMKKAKKQSKFRLQTPDGKKQTPMRSIKKVR